MIRGTSCRRVTAEASEGEELRTPELLVIDVRETFEWLDGHLEGAMHLPMMEAVGCAGEVPADRPKAVLCAGGLRSSTVISAAGLGTWGPGRPRQSLLAASCDIG